MTEPKSDCCGVAVTWGVGAVNTYTQADFYGMSWICSQCHKPCQLQEVKDEEA